ncbi:hypothetical protein [Ramlibacter humi]|uniref:Uncharacterized protein n=1 Tax=Ramlibacter humi TaxID=2530451 RepID=A0A4Z0BRH6_9BURK|nr:hypothetical protein [Ramlibacter humi]TFZ01926.1 hypothetical protein EZ216_12110 [Ramlibacter humi]
MSLLRWFTRSKRPAEAGHSGSLPGSDTTRPPPLGSRKVERTHRRELLYTIVRECMVRAGVLTSSYRFKVLSLDGRGRQFMIMVDLVDAPVASSASLAAVENMIAEAAKARHQIAVKGVYWRQNSASAKGAAVKQPAAKAAQPTPAKAPSEADPIDAAEIAAFQKALAAGLAKPAAPADTLAATPTNRTPSYTLLTGFEDTEQAEAAATALSATQYGELR